ncbi:hypothetical protein DPMN_017119 [Dreissena polymorpha]|uniref:PDZ domain-containing protein n=1 Tax=Dreissena polymorpha TaxID=45954 RepID=A0A9D4S7U3_DREPO|nr:hypothetical protein DPMN_017119 [Dreissena polymorpha]
MGGHSVSQTHFVVCGFCSKYNTSKCVFNKYDQLNITFKEKYFIVSERIQRRYGDLNGELHLVDLVQGTSGLGISLAGNKDRNTMSIFVAGIQPDSAADQDGRIIVGDELLEVKLKCLNLLI